ncbi:MAG: cation transporter, partial [Spirochaetia bacterium]
VVALWSGFKADSSALVGFGFDSVIESAAAAVLLWRVSMEAKGAQADEVERAEKRVHRFVGVTFFVLAIYVTVDSLHSLFTAAAPAESLVGIGLAVASLIIMPVISFFKLRAADRLNSPALRSEAKETLACSYLSFALLLGLTLHALSESLWWTDPAAALLMVPWLVHEGKEAFETSEG